MDDYNNLRQLLEHYRQTETGNEGIASMHLMPGMPVDPSKPKVDFFIMQGDPELIPASSFGHDWYQPLFSASGVVPTGDQRAKTVKIAPELDASAFTFESYHQEQGRRLAILRVDYDRRYKATTRYWIDLEHDSAIVRFAVQPGTTDQMICNIEYGLTAGLWLPRHWTSTCWHKRRTAISESIDVLMTTVMTEMASERFGLKPLPGMYIEEKAYHRDPRTKNMVVQRSDYRLNADGSKHEESGRLDVIPLPNDQ